MRSIFVLLFASVVSLAFFGCADSAKAQAVSLKARAEQSAEPSMNARAGSPFVFQNGKNGIALGAPLRHNNLAIFPLIISKSAKSNPFTPLDKAMDKGKLAVKELGSATVPQLSVKNSGKGKVFIMTGEIVTGAKQDRMSANDVLLPPHQKEVKLKVYCVEHGRWVENSRQFAAGKTAGTSMLRKTAAKKESQSKVWSKVAMKSGAASVSSSTGTMQAVYDDRKVKGRIAEFTKKLGSLGKGKADVVGFVAAIDGHIISADLFHNNELMRALWQKLLKAIAVDAVTSKTKRNAAPSMDDVRAFLKAGFDGKRTKSENPGLGEELLIASAGDISGTVLVYRGEIVHLSLFGPDREERPRALGPASRASRRAQGVAAEPSRSMDNQEVLQISSPKSRRPEGKKNVSVEGKGSQLKQRPAPKQKTFKKSR
jgi:hypothetical protein